MRGLYKRYLWLLNTVNQAGSEGITFTDINRKWRAAYSLSEGEDLPKRTFRNWIEAIETEFEVLISCDNRYHYYLEDAESLAGRHANRALKWLLSMYAVQSWVQDDTELQGRIVLEEVPSGEQHLATVIAALREARELEVDYYNYWHGNTLTYRLQPCFVKLFKRRWYVVALDVAADKLKIFALDRMRACTLTDNTFAMPPLVSLSPDTYFKDAFGIIVDDTPAEDITLKFTAGQQHYVRDLPLHHSQTLIEEGEDYAVYRYHLAPTYDFLQELRSYGEKVEVLSPDGLLE